LASERGALLRPSQLASAAFDRVRGKQKPGLTHPTLKAFDARAWGAFIGENDNIDRDFELATAALYFHFQFRSLREGPIHDSLKGLSAETAIRLAVAEANRACLIVRRRINARLASDAGNPDGVTITRPLLRVGGSWMQPDLTADDVITQIVDTLPHWFAQAAECGPDDSCAPTQLGRSAQLGEIALSIERGLRNLWQLVLWEGARLGEIDGHLNVHLGDVEQATLWAAWEFRQESLYIQESMLDAAEQRQGIVQNGGDAVLARTVTSFRREGRKIRFKFGPCGYASRHSQSFNLSAVQNSYISNFIDEELSENNHTVTPRMLLHAIFLLHDIALLLIAEIPRTEIRSRSDLRSLQMEVPSSAIIHAFRECMEIDNNIAAALLFHLSTDPSDLGGAFGMGIWHRPLIVRPAGEAVLLVAGAILFGAPIRMVERWLISSDRANNLSLTARGIAYETDVRTQLSSAIAANRLLNNAVCLSHAIKREGDGEEIDLIVQLGRTIIVGEIKCLLVPSESSERYDHIVKLESAAAQACRKSKWLEDNLGVLANALNIPTENLGEPIFLPVVVLNHGIGIGMSIGDCVVTDAHFLGLYLGSGSYFSSALVGPRGEVVRQSQILYQTENEAERMLPTFLRRPPGVEKFVRAIRWRQDDFPTSDGMIRVPAYELEEQDMMGPAHHVLARELMRRMTP
jgi:hypothetical protein